jgi:MFS transporter, DHA2 family, multidrug resistance protein
VVPLMRVGGFGLASALVAAAPTVELLVAARVLQGAFGALISVIGRPLVAEAVRPEHRARALSIVLTLIPLSGVGGPALGGLLTDAIGWRTVFLVNLPVAALALVWSGRTIPAGRRGMTGLPHPDRTAVQDALVLGAGVTALVLALGLFGAEPPAAGPAVALTAVAAVAAVLWARRPHSRPVLALLHRPRITWSLVALLSTVAGVGAVNFLVPYVLADAGATASTIGMVLLALAAAMAVTSPPAGLLADRVGTGPVVLAGTVAVLAGALWLVGAGATPLALAGPLALIGVGNGLFAGPNATVVLDATPDGEVGASSGLSSLVRTLGFTVGPALAAVLWTTTGGGAPGRWSGAVLLVALGAVAVLASAVQAGRRGGATVSAGGRAPRRSRPPARRPAAPPTPGP